MTVDMQSDEAEVWFRRRGLPLVVHGSAQGRALIARTVPALVFLDALALVSFLVTLIPESDPDDPIADAPWGYTDMGVADQILTTLTVLIALLVGAATVLGLPTLAAWMTQKALRGRSSTVQLVAGVVVGALSVVGLPVIGMTDLASYWAGAAEAIVAVVLVLVLVRLGVGAIMIWAIRTAARQISGIAAMASRVLPLLLLVVMFAFFTGELWQAVNALSRAQLWVAVTFLAVLAAGFLTTSITDELPALRAASRARADLQARLQDTPLAGTTTPAEHTPLSRPEQFNVALVLFLAQAVQVVAFVVVVFAFFIVFGVLMITPGVQEIYLAAAPPGEATFFGIAVPVSNALFQISLFLAAFSGLYFTASKTTDERYRRAFFEPLIDEIALSLAARDVYHERWPRG